MGTRANVPASPSGSEEASQTLTTALPRQSSGQQAPQRRVRTLFGVDRRFILAPFAALLLGSTFYVYSRTTVAAAKENARRAREADGGSISWRREGMRRHGRLERVGERTLWGQLTGRDSDVEKDSRGPVEKPSWDRNPIEDGIRKAREERNKASKAMQKKSSSETGTTD